MGKNGADDVGLMILASTSTFAIWSAFNPSFFTIDKFSAIEDLPKVQYGMNLGLVASLALAAGIFAVWGKSKAGLLGALATGGTGAILWVLYDQLVQEKLNGGQPIGVSI